MLDELGCWIGPSEDELEVPKVRKAKKAVPPPESSGIMVVDENGYYIGQYEDFTS